ncbi:deoxycytidyl transferase [Rhizina undulata]
MANRLFTHEENAKANLRKIQAQKDNFEGETGEEYGASDFGGFRDYFRRKRLKLQNQDAHLRTTLDSSSHPQIFANLVICINGYTKPSISELHQLIVKHGGTFVQYMDGKTTVTHIIAASLTPKKRIEFANYKVVKPEWIIESSKAGKLLAWADFRTLEPGAGQSKLSFGKTAATTPASTTTGNPTPLRSALRDLYKRRTQTATRTIGKAVDQVQRPELALPQLGTRTKDGFARRPATSSTSQVIPPSDEIEAEEEMGFDRIPSYQIPTKSLKTSSNDEIPSSVRSEVKDWGEDGPPSYQKPLVIPSSYDDSQNTEAQEGGKDAVNLVPVPTTSQSGKSSPIKSFVPSSMQRPPSPKQPAPSGNFSPAPEITISKSEDRPPPTVIIEGEPAYEVSRIVGVRRRSSRKPKHLQGKKEYLVEWKGYSANDATWELAQKLKEDLGNDLFNSMVSDFKELARREIDSDSAESENEEEQKVEDRRAGINELEKEIAGTQTPKILLSQLSQALSQPTPPPEEGEFEMMDMEILGTNIDNAGFWVSSPQASSPPSVEQVRSFVDNESDIDLDPTPVPSPKPESVQKQKHSSPNFSIARLPGFSVVITSKRKRELLEYEEYQGIPPEPVLPSSYGNKREITPEEDDQEYFEEPPPNQILPSISRNKRKSTPEEEDEEYFDVPSPAQALPSSSGNKRESTPGEEDQEYFEAPPPAQALPISSGNKRERTSEEEDDEEYFNEPPSGQFLLSSPRNKRRRTPDKDDDDPKTSPSKIAFKPETPFTATQFHIPLQIDPSVLPFLPTPMRTKIEKKREIQRIEQENLEKRRKEQESSRIDKGKGKEIPPPKPPEKESSTKTQLLPPPNSGYDIEIWNELDEDMKRTLIAEHDEHCRLEEERRQREKGTSSSSSKQRQPSSIGPQNHRKLPAENATRPQTNTLKVFGKDGNDIATWLFTEGGIDKDWYEAVDADSRQWAITQAYKTREAFLQEKEKKRREKVNEEQRRQEICRTAVRLLPMPKLGVLWGKASSIGEVREAIDVWFERHLREGPPEETVQTLETYVRYVAETEMDAMKAELVERWVERLVKGLGNKEVWVRVVDRVRRGVDDGLKNRGLGPLRRG